VDVDLRDLFRDLVRLETELWNRVDARVATGHGLPLGWLEIMDVIATTPGCRVLDVADALRITVGGTSKVVDKLQAAGWVRRRPNPDDGRSSLLELTRTGERLRRAADATFGAELAARVGSAAPTVDLERLAADLRRLRAHLGES
jgi:MarR family transcriptional regulator, organic hydroperoxide resistance regulator